MKQFSLILITCLSILTACGKISTKTATPSPEPSATNGPTISIFTPPPIYTPQPTATPKPKCPVPNLLVWQYISADGSYTQTETEAAGPMVCQIGRDSCAYYHLIGNLSPTIAFKQEEQPPFDGEDILMHPEMLLPLTRLSKLVANEWDGQYWLRVTDAYDSLMEHDLAQTDTSAKNSLHFEGRSIDLTTWPIDTDRYGRLCALAHCAGFDWVHNEGDHCHASIQAESLCLRCSN